MTLALLVPVILFQLRHLCEERIGQNLRHLKEDIDSLIIEILGQMEKASKIFDFMYLVSNPVGTRLDGYCNMSSKALHVRVSLIPVLLFLVAQWFLFFAQCP